MNNEPVAWDRGTWTVGETESQEFIESSDFNHDVRLYLNGDFEDNTQRLNYLKHIADRLNIHPAKELTDEEIRLLETEIFVKDAIIKCYKEALEQIATGEIAGESTNYKDTVYVMRNIALDALAILRKAQNG